MNKVFQDLYKLIWTEIFPDIPPLPVEEFKRLYTPGLNLPEKVSCAISGEVLYSPVKEYKYKRFISETEAHKRIDIDNFLKPYKKLNSLAEVIENIKDISFFRGSRSLNSEDISESDDIYSSSQIFASSHIYSCQKMLLCEGNKSCEYLMASKGNGESSFGIRLHDSGSISNSFDIHWSGNSSNCYFCADAYDLRDCMFCFHIVSKQYCIGNTQYEREEYEELRSKILKDYFEQLKKPSPFITLKDI